MHASLIFVFGQLSIDLLVDKTGNFPRKKKLYFDYLFIVFVVVVVVVVAEPFVLCRVKDICAENLHAALRLF